VISRAEWAVLLVRETRISHLVSTWPSAQKRRFEAPTFGREGSILPLEALDIEGHWAAGDIRTALERSVLHLLPGDRFEPDRLLSGLELVDFLADLYTRAKAGGHSIRSLPPFREVNSELEVSGLEVLQALRQFEHTIEVMGR
jgi:hypothetical protein